MNRCARGSHKNVLSHFSICFLPLVHAYTNTRLKSIYLSIYLSVYLFIYLYYTQSNAYAYVTYIYIHTKNTYAYIHHIEYGRSCKDIGCRPSETCVISHDSCSWPQQENKDCGSYPTCKRSTNMNNSPGKIPTLLI